ncbi:MAG: zinc-binding dehydrogenase [Gammaproteobacteria bacterium]|tara:strand:- start:4248 stop:5372 length:1125 start_codon:yes stop_codon:yes gene_type:complete
MSSNKQITSTVTDEGKLEIAITESERPIPGDDEVLIQVEATPINPSDLGLLIGPGDINTLKAEDSKIIMDVPKAIMGAMEPRLNKPMPVGNEGSGVVIEAGVNAQELLGKVVSVVGGGMYTQYRCLPAASCMVMNEGTEPRDCASSFVNPLTALGMVETMKMEGHTALVHTAAASNLGQMLVKICKDDGVQLVNIVRKQEHVDLLKSFGAQFVCNSSDDGFMEQLTSAITETKATLAFDATGGGELAGKILACMEAAARKNATEYSPYGSTDHKQVYIYGALNQSGITLPNNRSFGMYWGIGGFLLTPFLSKVGFEKMGELQARVASEIKTTFASTYTQEVSLEEVLTLESLMVYAKQATGEKFLINPNAKKIT